MSNMSYCRFQNTLNDLRDCEEALQELVDGDAEGLSQYELPAAEELAACCIRIVRVLVEQGGLDLSNADHPQFDDKLSEVVSSLCSKES